MQPQRFDCLAWVKCQENSTLVIRRSATEAFVWHSVYILKMFVHHAESRAEMRGCQKSCVVCVIRSGRQSPSQSGAWSNMTIVIIVTKILPSPLEAPRNTEQSLQLKATIAVGNWGANIYTRRGDFVPTSCGSAATSLLLCSRQENSTLVIRRSATEAFVWHSVYILKMFVHHAESRAEMRGCQKSCVVCVIRSGRQSPSQSGAWSNMTIVIIVKHTHKRSNNHNRKKGGSWGWGGGSPVLMHSNSALASESL